MAYLITHFWPGATEDQYNATIALLDRREAFPRARSTMPPGRPTAGY